MPRPSRREEIYKIIDEERVYQNTLPPERTEGVPHTVGNYLVMMRHYMGRAEDAWTLNPGDKKALDVIRKIAAIAVRCMEENGAIRREE